MKIKNVVTKVAATGAGVMASASAFAVDHSAAINTAVTEGQANYTLVVVGVIGLAAIGFGVGMILRSMKA